MLNVLLPSALAVVAGISIVVQQVLSGSAVASTGMTAGDAITALDGKAVTSTDSLSSLMGTQATSVTSGSSSLKTPST